MNQFKSLPEQNESKPYPPRTSPKFQSSKGQHQEEEEEEEKRGFIFFPSDYFQILQSCKRRRRKEEKKVGDGKGTKLMWMLTFRDGRDCTLV